MELILLWKHTALPFPRPAGGNRCLLWDTGSAELHAASCSSWRTGREHALGIRKQLCMDMTVITQLYCKLYVTCQLHVSANTIFGHHKVGHRLRWSRGSVLAFRTQVRGSKPGRSHQIFRAKKNPQHAFLRRGSKAVGPTSYICDM